jgi:hypothetical protein
MTILESTGSATKHLTRTRHSLLQPQALLTSQFSALTAVASNDSIGIHIMCIVHKHQCRTEKHFWYEQVDCAEVNANLKCRFTLPELKDEGSNATCRVHSGHPAPTQTYRNRPILLPCEIKASVVMAKTSPETYPRVSAHRSCTESLEEADQISDSDSKLAVREASPLSPTQPSSVNPDPSQSMTISASEYDFPWYGVANWEYMERVLFKRKRLSPREAFQRLESRKEKGQQRGCR